ncbi:class III extradiol dioxygenase family protein [Hirschia baltica]|uniref:Extradiol ring-cleavage dioxygenase class III protein subunit B n=1 Tax=Hirschia baltica (strain ATCC 49814 / DSM 5838 / IFAM 1418) TaxID=582402 RepID=C6XPK2_HIRBI|nr:class III extradiol dioxygenase family protein [Hirschia baltica]ACT60267.1 Extradiol ring-cleavage dioxygenase class III protein subunit B [Hirschia baltica ATCC 49814]
MANIIGAIATSHVPSIGDAIKGNLQGTPKWKGFFDAFPPVHDWLEKKKPDLIVMLYSDHGLNFFLDNRPTFAVGAAPSYGPGDEGFGPPAPREFQGDDVFSWHLIESLVKDEFDIATCQEMKLDHACLLAGDLLWPEQEWPAKVQPIDINIMQHPVPSFKRCFKLGQAIGRAIESYPDDLNVAIVASGGLSHQINLAGFINEDFDRMCLDKIVNAPEDLLDYSIENWVDLAGSQGLEFTSWISMRGAMPKEVRVVTQTYFQPLSNTGGAVLLLEPDA